MLHLYKRKTNRKLIKTLRVKIKEGKINNTILLQHVKAHAGDFGNETADKLADAGKDADKFIKEWQDLIFVAKTETWKEHMLKPGKMVKIGLTKKMLRYNNAPGENPDCKLITRLINRKLEETIYRNAWHIDTLREPIVQQPGRQKKRNESEST